MTDLISRAALLKHLQKERDDYFREHFAQDPATGTWEARTPYEEELEQMDARIALIDDFPAVEPLRQKGSKMSDSELAKLRYDNKELREAIDRLLSERPALIEASAKIVDAEAAFYEGERKRLASLHTSADSPYRDELCSVSAKRSALENSAALIRATLSRS